MKVSVIGCGNMGKALIGGFLKSGAVKKSLILGCDASAAALENVGIKTTTDAVYACGWADLVVVAVKPQQLEELLLKLETIKSVGKKIFISVVAAKTTKYFQGFLGGKTAVIRAMPNTPALIGEGAIAFCGSKGCGKKHLDAAERLLSAAGRTVQVDEKFMDAVTAISGSGPAYVFFLAEILIQAGLRSGLEESAAKMLVYQTLYGSSLMLKSSNKPPEELRENVTSPGGTTEAAFDFLNKEKIFDKWIKAVFAARNRSKFLSV